MDSNMYNRMCGELSAGQRARQEKSNQDRYVKANFVRCIHKLGFSTFVDIFSAWNYR